MLTKKICLLGAYAVGKTSLAQRFVYSRFSEKYHSTLGVKVDRKVLRIESLEVHLMIWDVAGEDGLFSVPLHYVRGAAGCLVVADGTRPETLESAVSIGRRVRDEIGRLPITILLNKHDLEDLWTLDKRPALPERWPLLTTSAKTGEGVEEAFEQLTRRILGRTRG